METMQATGIENKIKKKFAWGKQPNGKYTIFSVPIFSTFKREDVDEQGNKIVRSCNKNELHKIVKSFENSKDEGYYPRIHIGHQDLNGVSNAPGVGYLDNLQVCPIKDFVVCSDFTEISEETLQRFKNLDFLGSSCEYKPGSIEGLALLETKPPYFKFGVIALEDNPIPQLGEETIQRFENRSKVLQFMEEKQLDELEKEKKAVGEEEKEQLCSDKKTSQMQEDGDSGGDMKAILNELVTGHKELIAGQQKIIDFLYQDDEEEEEEEEAEQMQDDLQKPDSDTVSSDDPESVAFSANKNKMLQFQNQMKNQMLQMQKNFNAELQAIKGEREINQFESKLKKLCMTSNNVDFGSINYQMQQFSSAKDKQMFLDFVENNAMQFQNPSAPGAMLTAVKSKKADFMQQFSGKPMQIQMAAKNARVDYWDTVNQTNSFAGKRFKQLNPCEEKFVQQAVFTKEAELGLLD